MPEDYDSNLEKECGIFTRYLTGESPSEDLVQRYSRANTILFGEPPSPEEGSVLRFVLRNPWSLGFIDGASAFFMKDNILRGKILVMISILEAHPGFTKFFIPGPVSRFNFFVKGGFLGFSAIFKCLIGFFLLPLARRSG